METRVRRLARLVRLIEQRQASSEARRAVLDAQARKTDDERRMLLQTMDAGLGAHGRFVDLLARRMKRLDAETRRIEHETATLAVQMREGARRVRLAERLYGDAVRDEAREREKQGLADLIDSARTVCGTSPTGTAPAAAAASFPKD